MKDLRRNEFLELMAVNELLYEEHEYHIKADIPGLGAVTYYPKKNSLNIHAGNKWEKDGFDFTKGHLENRKSADIAANMQHRNTRHDAIDILNNKWAEYNKQHQDLPLEAVQMMGEIIRDIQNMKQRKP